MSDAQYIERYWRDAVPQDAIKEPPMTARFLKGNSDWFIGKLLGCWRDLHDDNLKWGTGNGLCYTTCQVYDAPEPKYVPFTWDDREQLRGRLITFVDRDRTVEFRCESFSIDDDGLLVNDTYAPWLLTHAVFVDTKEPVGKKVE